LTGFSDTLVALSVPVRVAWLLDAQRVPKAYTVPGASLSSATHPSWVLLDDHRLERLPADAFMHLLVLTDR